MGPLPAIGSSTRPFTWTPCDAGPVAARISWEDLVRGAHSALSLDATGRPDPALVVVDLDGVDWAALPPPPLLERSRTPVLVGVAHTPLSAAALPVLEHLSCTIAPDGPGRVVATSREVEADVERVLATVRRAPVAAVTLVGLLELTARVGVPDGLLAESLAYSSLLAGEEFRAWRFGTPRREARPAAEPVRVTRVEDRLLVTLNRPQRHNAFDRATRDALLAALDVAVADHDVTVELGAEGPSFCSGGDLDEFGTADDVALAHLVRTTRSVGLALDRLRGRSRVVVHGACIGAGVELPAFAGTVVAREGAWFRLPELGMGLVPGAGGTVSVTRRIGRWRTAYLALTDSPLDLERALAWGLVDARA